MSFKDFVESKTFQKILWGIGAFIVALIIFQAGVFVGFSKASFSYRLGDNFHSAFGEGPRGAMMFPPGSPEGFSPGGFSEAHGVAGKIIKISLPTVFVEGNDAVEKTILINDDTLIKEFRQTISPADLKVDDNVVVIGTPNTQGQIEAKLIRVVMEMATSSLNKN